MPNLISYTVYDELHSCLFFHYFDFVDNLCNNNFNETFHIALRGQNTHHY